MSSNDEAEGKAEDGRAKVPVKEESLDGSKQEELGVSKNKHFKVSDIQLENIVVKKLVISDKSDSSGKSKESILSTSSQVISTLTSLATAFFLIYIGVKFDFSFKEFEKKKTLLSCNSEVRRLQSELVFDLRSVAFLRRACSIVDQPFCRDAVAQETKLYDTFLNWRDRFYAYNCRTNVLEELDQAGSLLRSDIDSLKKYKKFIKLYGITRKTQTTSCMCID